MKLLRFLLNYAGKNLQRNHRRSLLLIATVAIAVAASIVAHDCLQEAFKFWIGAVTESGVGDAQLHQRGFSFSDTGLNRTYLFAEGNALEGALSNDDKVAAFTKRLSIDGLISKGNRSMYFNGVGVSPDAEYAVSPRLAEFGHSREEFPNDEQPSGVAIGRGLANSLNAKVGDLVTLTVNMAESRVNAIDASIIGIIDFPDTQLSKRLVYLHLDLAQSATDVGSYYSEIALRVRPNVDLAKWVQGWREREIAQQVQIEPWWEIFPQIKKIQSIWTGVLGLICLMLFLSCALSVLNIIFLMVGERRIEIGILMAIGAKTRHVWLLFAVEAAIVGLLGGLGGVLLGGVIVTLMGYWGLPVPNPFFSGSILLYPEFSWTIALLAFISAVLVAICAVLLPANAATRIDPVEAFRL